MPRSVQVDVAKGITKEINSGSFSKTFTARRQYGDLDFVLSKADKLVVDVIPYDVRHSLANRSESDYLIVTTICVRYKFPKEVITEGVIDVDEVDPYMILLQELHDHFVPSQPDFPNGRVLTDYPEAVWQEAKQVWPTEEPAILAPFDKFLHDNNQFVGLARVVYLLTCKPNGS